MSKSRTHTARGQLNPRVVFLGMRVPFSRIALSRLVAEGIAVQAVVVPAGAADEPIGTAAKQLAPEPSRSELPLLTRFVEPDIVHLAWDHDVSVFEVSRLSDPTTLATLTSFQPDALCVACFSQRIPPPVLELPRYGCLNLHPSLLPAYRGPAPLFWTFRNGEREAGATVHMMDEGLDTGDIVLQERITIPEGIRGEVLEERLARRGGRLMAEAVRSLAAGTASPRRQREEDSSYYPWPSAEDFRISPAWPARQAFNFIRGVAHLDGPLEIEVAGRAFSIRDAVSYSPSRRLDRPFVRDSIDLWVQCTPGVLHVKVY